jgi:ribonuclease-3
MTSAPAARDPAIGELERRLRVTVTNPDTALAAITHKSFVNEHRGEPLQDNERLEFLGDAVLNLAVSQRLMERFPGAREGELSKIRAAVVDEPGLAFIARELDLGAVLRLGRGEELTGGREKSSLLADAVEAVVAALYLGGGLDPVLALIDRFLGDAFARAAAGTLDRDYKTQLQELAQSRMRASPRYRVVAEHGPDHSKTFEVELEIGGESVGRGSGRSKKDAEQAAAKLALDVLRTPVPPPAEPAPVETASEAEHDLGAPEPSAALVAEEMPVAPSPPLAEKSAAQRRRRPATVGTPKHPARRPGPRPRTREPGSRTRTRKPGKK